MKCQVSRSHLANVLNGQMLPIPPLARRSASFALKQGSDRAFPREDSSLMKKPTLPHRDLPSTAALVGLYRQLYARADDKTECRNFIHLLRRCRGDGAAVRFS